jgi:3-oxoacyl-[acyl-carrier protein] reductase
MRSPAAIGTAPPRRGCAVLAAFLQIDDPADSGIPQSNRDHRTQDAVAVVAAIREDGGRALAAEADLSDPATPASLFDVAEEQFGPVAILVNDATGGWHWAR